MEDYKTTCQMLHSVCIDIEIWTEERAVARGREE